MSCILKLTGRWKKSPPKPSKSISASKRRQKSALKHHGIYEIPRFYFITGLAGSVTENCFYGFPYLSFSLTEIGFSKSKEIVKAIPSLDSSSLIQLMRSQGMRFFFSRRIEWRPKKIILILRILENAISSEKKTKKTTNKQTKKPQEFISKFNQKHMKIHETKIPGPATKEDKYC